MRLGRFGSAVNARPRKWQGGSGLVVKCLRGFVAGIVAILAITRLDAHPIWFNSTIAYLSSPPSGAAASISNWTGAAFDAANIGGSGTNSDGSPNNGSANDASTYVANNQPVQGQTFTTGSNVYGYDVSGITVRMTGYTNNTATGSNLTGWNLNFTNGPIIVTIGKISGTTQSAVSMQCFMAGGTGNPGSGSSANGTGTYLTFSLPYSVHLAPNTTYGFDFIIGNGGSNYFEWLGTSSDVYSGGTAYTRSGSTITPLAGDRVFMVNMAASSTAYAPFVHPGVLHTQADFTRMATKVTAGAAPWITDYNILTSSPFAQTSWPAYSVTYIVRGPSGNNYTRSQEDAQAIYELALRWKISGNTTYADHAVQIANVWSNLQGVTGDTNAALAGGICGYLFASAGEILSTYSGWADADKQAYKDMMMRVFYPSNFDFLWRHFDTFWRTGGNTHYRLNWDADNVASMAAIGILCDNKAVYQQAVDYFKNGPGNGRVERAAWYIHPDGTAQTEESGRDQAHNQGGWYSLALLCQMAWNQGDDLFSYDNNRVLRAFEYNAKYNLGNDVSWVYHRNSDISYTETLSGASRGLSQYYAYELVYNHYANVAGIAAPYCKLAMQATRPEPRPDPNIHPSQVDWLGLGSLTFARDAITTSAAPSGLVGQWSKNQVILTWWGSATATSYQIQRATSASGPYTVLGTVTEPNLNFTDTNVTNGASYYYKVTANTPAGNLDSAPLLVNQALVTQYTFEGNTNDVVGTRNASALGGTSAPGYATGHGGGQAISLNGSDQYVKLPVGSGNYRDITIAAWIYWNGGNAWQRIFDFGSEMEKFMMLTVKDSSGVLRFQMTTSRATDGTLTLTGPTIPTATWTHVAITINGDTVTMYVNGVPVAANTSPMVAPVFGQPYCYIGKSMWTSDPIFNGRIDDFRIYNYALTGRVVYSLGGGSTNHAPAFSSNPINLPVATQGVNYSGSSQNLSTIASDADGGTLTYTKVSGPSWLTVASNGALSGAPGNADVGTNAFVVRVSDSTGASDDANLYVTVNNVNDPPIWSSNSITEPNVTRGQPYTSFNISGYASDPDTPYGDTITFSKASGPGWLTVGSDGTLSGTPGASDVGTNTFTVRVTDAAGAHADTTLTIAVLPFEARASYGFEGNTSDALGNYPITATGGISYGTGRIGQGVAFDGTSGYLTLPAGVADSQELTVTAWVYWNGGSDWQRIFDFGNGTSQYVFLTPSAGGKMQFGITNNGTAESVTTSSLTTRQWVHVAVTLSSAGGKIYVNGALVATSASMTMSPGDFRPIYNYIGKSQYSADPFFNGMIDEFHVYNYALGASEISAMMNITPAMPIGVVATPRSGSISLSWNASQGAQTYTVKRSLMGGGPYTTLASGLTSASYTDSGLTNGTTYYYVVSATNDQGESPNSAQVASVPSDFMAWLKFDESSGAIAADATGDGWNATLVNSPAWGLGIMRNAVNLPASASQYLSFPSGIVSGLNDFTICCWVKLNTLANVRVFDFGTGSTFNSTTGTYMMLTPNSSSGNLRFAITTSGYGNEQSLTSSTALTAGTWTHIAVTLSGSTCKLYINGSVVAVKTNMTLEPSNLGNTTQNYIGKSQYSADPYLSGAIDDFRIYSRALSTNELTALANPLPETPGNLVATPGNASVALTWNSSNGCTSYNMKRATVRGGPYTTIATGLAALAYSDTSVSNNTAYYYVVSGTGPQGESTNSSEVVAVPSSISLYLKFDESGGTTAVDASGQGWNGTLYNGSTWVGGKLGNAVGLDGASSYVGLPLGIVSGLSECTISAWVYWNGGSAWQRLFDLGTGTTNYMFLTPKSGSGNMRFSIATPGTSEQRIDASAALPAGSWHYVSVVLNGATGTIYLDGTQVGQNTAMTLTPSSLGTTTQNWIGRSQFSADPYFSGCVDDFRIYSSALGATTIAALASPSQASGLAAVAGDQQAALSWNAGAQVISYTLRRTTASGSNYSVIASGIAGTSYIDTGLANGTTYYYTVTATDALGDGLPSIEASVTPSVPISSTELIAPELIASSGDAGTNSTIIVKASVPGHVYQLQYTSDLRDGTWQNIGSPETGTGADLEFGTVGTGSLPIGFYRIQVQR